MWLFDIFKDKKEAVSVIEKPFVNNGYNVRADFMPGAGLYRSLFSVLWNGEKNLGEIGPIKSYVPDYEALRLRSWQAYLDSEIAQTIINKKNRWTIGRGLKLQAEPNVVVLKSEKIKLDVENFSEIAEARFTVFAKSRFSSFSKMSNLNTLASKAYLNSIVGGDVLVIMRFIDNNLTVQLIDGSMVCSPSFGDEYYPQALANGNKILNGIEMNDSGEHIAYYVRKANAMPIIAVDRIEAKNSLGYTTSFLVYGLEYRLNNVRGLPLIAAVLETLKKLERYKEATVGSAEERQKISYFIQHESSSTGESPLAKQIAKAYDTTSLGFNDEIPKDVNGNALADTVAVSTNKQVFNMPVGSELKSLESKAELHFKDFYGVNTDIVCAAVDIPPNVAMSKYDSNFSASRAALKDWEHTLTVDRQRFAFQFMQPIYNFWLYIEILKNNIQAPGYLKALDEGNLMVIESYTNARFVGSNVPHIDPEKEVRAERLKLGLTGASIPLTTVEAATESLNEGDSDANMAQYALELEESKKLKIEVPIAPAAVPPMKEKKKGKTKPPKD